MVKVPTGTIKMLRVEDCVKDRLASFFYWNDRQGLEQAINVCRQRKVDYEEIKQWALKEGFEEKFNQFIERLAKV